MSSPSFDVAAADRWFAIQFNNAAWDLVEAESRSPAETEQMLHLAHAACLHWSAVGTPLNRLRGLVLLAFAYAEAGRGEMAQEFAASAADLLPTISEGVSVFDQATLAAATACACRALGDSEGTANWLERVRELSTGIADPDDAAVVKKLAMRGRGE